MESDMPRQGFKNSPLLPDQRQTVIRIRKMFIRLKGCPPLHREVPRKELPLFLIGSFSVIAKVPEEFGIDKEHAGDCLMSPEYAKDFSDYLKSREEKFVLSDYMHNQPDLNQDMRAILIDRMVELQERCPPCFDDFLYICDDAYKRRELPAMEMNVLRGLNFDINIPVPYRFLRRYAKVARVNMETLTFVHYVCELSLLEVELVPEVASLLALIIQGLGGWSLF